VDKTSKTKGTILYNLNSKEIFVSRNVVHHDHILPYTSSSTSTNWYYNLSFSSPEYVVQTNSDWQSTTSTHEPDSSSITPIQSTTANTPNETSPTSPNDTQPQFDPPTRPVRTKHMHSYLSDFVCNQTSSLADCSSKGSIYPISEYHSLSQLSQTHHAYTMSITHIHLNHNLILKHVCMSPDKGL
jgi:hypothetical protein